MGRDVEKARKAVERLEAGLAEQRARLADAADKRAAMKERWSELVLAADVDGADTAKDVASAEAELGRLALEQERAELAVAELGRRIEAARAAVSEATYHEARARIAALDKEDAKLENAYITAARALKGAAQRLYEHAEAKRAEWQRAQPWAAASGARNPQPVTPTPFGVPEEWLAATVMGRDILEEHIAKRLARGGGR